MSEHERIWLEPQDGSDPDTGRMWCQHPAPGLNDDRTWTEYVRADLVAAREAAAREEGKREGIEAAAAETDCGCAARPDVLARLAEVGHKRASYLCSHGDACCALQAFAIRALLPAKEDGR